MIKRVAFVHRLSRGYGIDYLPWIAHDLALNRFSRSVVHIILNYFPLLNNIYLRQCKCDGAYEERLVPFDNLFNFY